MQKISDPDWNFPFHATNSIHVHEIFGMEWADMQLTLNGWLKQTLNTWLNISSSFIRELVHSFVTKELRRDSYLFSWRAVGKKFDVFRKRTVKWYQSLQSIQKVVMNAEQANPLIVESLYL